ncbi:hypothetical protein L1U36_004435 [Salmonella enterica subsp. enterica serovar Kentucky]|nr:hypothetical protein [Salmonella enterica subsp. enterica serovar Kentucky]EBO2204658.1 hypothetical protein [Salmonella enterica subsp. enterica serovar Kentucky]EBZ7148963.1 hypothetical protein [Salmonella enterica subsp. enterica serovar Kentucky]EBZ8413239.1 hypothetical protein [Salmonella enterica subsp. enterica serovar Kentucky]ECA9642195.1 hypothetical protein [Salmonella enterica subsp. enterica serovar Kentucky]
MSDPVRITNPGAESLGYDSDGHEIMAVDIYVNPPRVDVFRSRKRMRISVLKPQNASLRRLLQGKKMKTH